MVFIKINYEKQTILEITGYVSFFNARFPLFYNTDSLEMWRFLGAEPPDLDAFLSWVENTFCHFSKKDDSDVDYTSEKEEQGDGLPDQKLEESISTKILIFPFINERSFFGSFGGKAIGFFNFLRIDDNKKPQLNGQPIWDIQILDVDKGEKDWNEYCQELAPCCNIRERTPIILQTEEEFRTESFGSYTRLLVNGKFHIQVQGKKIVDDIGRGWKTKYNDRIIAFIWQERSATLNDFKLPIRFLIFKNVKEVEINSSWDKVFKICFLSLNRIVKEILRPYEGEEIYLGIESKYNFVPEDYFLDVEPHDKDFRFEIICPRKEKSILVFMYRDNNLSANDKNIIYSKNINNMTNINNEWEKELIIQWEGLELRDEVEEDSDGVSSSFENSGSSFYENFAVIGGYDEEFLLFRPDFFAETEYKNSFQKGKVYRFSFCGELKKNSAHIVEFIEGGEFEISEISEMVPFVKSTYKEKEKSVEGKSVIEKELEEKNKVIQEINKERFDVKKELAELKIKFDSLQFEKTEIESKWTTPERHKELIDIQKELEEELATAKKENSKLSSQLEKINKQDWNTALAKKIQSKKSELWELKDEARNKLDNNTLKSSLEVYLTANEQLTVLRMEKVDERVCSPTKKQMERSEENLRKKLGWEELQNIRRIHSELIKMEVQQKQWEEWKTQEQQMEANVEVPITIID